MELDEDMANILTDLCAVMAQKARTNDGSYCVTSHAINELTKHIVDYNYDLTEQGFKHLKHCTQWNASSRCFEGTFGPICFMMTVGYICTPTESELAKSGAAKERTHEGATTEKRQKHPENKWFLSGKVMDKYEDNYDLMYRELGLRYGVLIHIVNLAGCGRTKLLVDIIERYRAKTLRLFDPSKNKEEPPIFDGVSLICNEILRAAIYANNESLMRNILLMKGPFEFLNEHYFQREPVLARNIVIEPNTEALNTLVGILQEQRPYSLKGFALKLRQVLDSNEMYHRPLVEDLLNKIEGN